ncbi:MAG: bifunctional folylpolyglutamate synthase/dihydrofolate synthase, partial [Sulfobacillus sp.]
VEQVAWNKAGIIKPGVPCITGASDKAQRVLRQEAQEMGVPLIDARSPVVTHSASLHGQRVDLRVGETVYTGLELSLLGRHQAQNAVVALEALEAARQQGLRLSDEAIREGLRSARWPGRFEVWDADAPTPVVLDCAHNEASMAALAATLSEYFPGRKAVVVLGMLADKEVDQSIRHLLPHVRAIVVTTPRNARALDAVRMAAKLPSALVAVVEPEPEKALSRARRMLRAGELLLITGSCYLVGPLRRTLAVRP